MSRNRRISRRRLLAYAAGLAASLQGAALGRARPVERPRFPDDPFKLGVASGDPVPLGFVIWTRLAPLPLSRHAFSSDPVLVRWQVARDQNMLQVAREGVAIARPEDAHAVHVEVQGLEPGQDYFYRFVAGDAESPVGRARTAPLIGAPTESLRFAFCSCQSLTDGYFAAYRDMVAQAPELILHLGDYIYESDHVGGPRRIPVAEAMDLADYRVLYARYKLDPALQAAHAAAPWLAIWDDHEVENDWGGDESPDGLNAEAFVRRKTAAFKAYFEHLPLRLSARPAGARLRLYQRSVIGDLIQFDLLDCRQYRDRQACRGEPRNYRSYTEPCAESEAAQRSLLGAEQEGWLMRGFGRYGAKWNVLAQTTFLAPFDFLAGPGRAHDMDGWDGFAAGRQRLLDLVAGRGAANPVAIGGNIHATYAGVVPGDASDPASAPMMSEIVGTSISSSGGGNGRYASTRAQFSENPFARYFENRRRGYILCDVGHAAWTARVRTVANVLDPVAPSSTSTTLTIESGKVEVAVG